MQSCGTKWDTCCNGYRIARAVLFSNRVYSTDYLGGNFQADALVDAVQPIEPSLVILGNAISDSAGVEKKGKGLIFSPN